MHDHDDDQHKSELGWVVIATFSLDLKTKMLPVNLNVEEQINQVLIFISRFYKV